MNNVPAVSPGSAQVLEPVTEGSVDELRDTRVPAQEDELPQGVLDLLATLNLRQPSRRSAVQGAAGADGKVAGSPTADLAPSPTRSGVPLVAKQLLAAKLAPVGAPVQRSDLPAMATLEAPINPQALPRLATEPSPSPAEPLPVERAANISTPTELAADAPLPEALMNLHSVRHALSVAAVSIPLPAPPMPRPALDMLIEPLPGSSHGLLQVPFNKGAASGQVTISRVPDEPTQHLLLSPSNSLVFEQLKAPFERVQDCAWQLTDDGGGQQHQGSHQSPDEEQTQQQELPA